MIWEVAILQSIWLHLVRSCAFQWPRSHACAAETGRTRRCGNAFVNVQMHLASKEHWASHRRQVYDLDVDAAAWQAFAASVRGLGGSV